MAPRLLQPGEQLRLGRLDDLLGHLRVDELGDDRLGPRVRLLLARGDRRARVQQVPRGPHDAPWARERDGEEEEGEEGGKGGWGGGGVVVVYCRAKTQAVSRMTRLRIQWLFFFTTFL